MKYSVVIKEHLVLDNGLIDINSLKAHEEVVQVRKDKLLDYLVSLKPYVIIPSILVCNSTNMIIDGHHRYYALREMGYSKVPVTFLNYQSELILPHIDNSVTKNELLLAAQSGKLLKPKSSFHHVMDVYFNLQPIILLSSLFKLDNF